MNSENPQLWEYLKSYLVLKCGQWTLSLSLSSTEFCQKTALQGVLSIPPQIITSIYFILLKKTLERIKKHIIFKVASSANRKYQFTFIFVQQVRKFMHTKGLYLQKLIYLYKTRTIIFASSASITTVTNCNQIYAYTKINQEV